MRNCLITGASSGIGEALFHLASLGPGKLFLLARRAKDIQDPPKKHASCEIHRIPIDMQNVESISNAIDQILETKTPIHALFNNAGISAHGRFDELDLSVFHKTFATNFFGPVQLIQGLLPALSQARGVVVSTSTVSALYGIPGRSAYSASKAALHACMESMRIELREQGIRSALVCVPYTKTNLRNNVIGPDGKSYSEPQADAKLKTPEEVAQVLWQTSLKKNPRLVTMSTSGIFLKWMRFLSPALLERSLHKKLNADFQKKH